MRIAFLGAAGTVTGSKYLLEYDERRILIDCGIFQGLKQWRLQNWEPLDVPPARIGAVILTHAHLDHCGYLPVLIRDGFRGPVFCTAATRDLAAVILADSGRLQEDDAAHANQHGYSRHHPAQPLYTEQDAVRSLAAFTTVDFGSTFTLPGGGEAVLHRAGHILGAATVLVKTGGSSVLFSGDLGRNDDAFMGGPEAAPPADFVVVESTYGNRRHPKKDPRDELEGAVAAAASSGGALLIPAFAVARAQQLIYTLHQLRTARRIPDIPVYVDTPMGVRANEVFLRYAAQLAVPVQEFREALAQVRVTHSVADSRLIDAMSVPRVIISASGMATGGRVLHHLAALAPDHRNTIALAGYQVAGTRGADLRAGAKRIKIHGRYVDVRARVLELCGFSSHADYVQTLQWLESMGTPPRRVFVTHGEPESADALRRRIEERFAWPCSVPMYREVADLRVATDSTMSHATAPAALNGVTEISRHAR